VKVCRSCRRRFEASTWVCPACGHAPDYNQQFVDLTPRDSKPNASIGQVDVSEIADLEDTHPWFRSRADLVAWAMQRFCPNAGSFLDVGCGAGLILRTLSHRYPNLVLSGGDPCLVSLCCAESRVPGASLFRLDAQSIPFESEYDVVGAFDVLEHILDDRGALSQMRQAARPGGSLLVTVPQHPFLWSPFDEYSGHVRRYTRQGLVDKAREAGWEVVYATSFVSLLLPVIVSSRVLFRGGLRKDPLREMRLRGPLNSLVRGVLSGEQFLIRCGVRFPMGSSLLLVGRRLEAADAEG
jgi:SAM-dependent methyltransferase